MRVRLLCILAAAAATTAAGCGDDGRPRLTVAAASDLRFALERMEEGFERECACDVVFSFGSSGTLTAQIEQGLPVDVLFSANADYIERLDEGGFVDPATIRPYAVGHIVVAVASGSATGVPDLVALAGSDIRRVALANPEHAPYGAAGKQALESTGAWDAVEGKLVLGESASQATQFVQAGDADAGIVPLSLAIQSGDDLDYEIIDSALHEPLVQVAAVTKRAREPELAGRLIAYIVEGGGREVMEEFGFAAPGEEDD